MDKLMNYWGSDDTGRDTAVGRDIGFEFSRTGMALPADCPRAVEEGFVEGRHKHGTRVEQSTPYERKLIRLRLSAYRRNRILDPMVTSAFLAGIDMKYCPITRIELTRGTKTHTDATVDRVFNGGGYAIGNLAIMSQKANEAKGGLLPLEILEISKKEDGLKGLSAIEWRRLACLTMLAAPPGYPRAPLPMLVYPPNGILLTNGNTLIQQCASAIAAGYVPERWKNELRNTLSGKASKKRFDAFMEALIGSVSRAMLGIVNPELQHFALCDCWESQLVYGRYTAFIQVVTQAELQTMARVATKAQQSFRKFSALELQAWSIETGGYK